MKIWDISRALTNDLAPWPGDTPFHFKLTTRIAEGAVVNIGAIGMSVHNGSHADAPFHFQDDGITIEKTDLEIYFGRAAVIDLTSDLRAGAELIEIGHLSSRAAEIGQAGRVLLKTGGWNDSTVFPKRIPVISPDVPEWLQARGVRLLGLDVPSVDPVDAKILKNHHALARAGIAIIESLDLSGVDSGVYNFAAFPLKIAGADGAPVRAVLWRE